MYVRMCVLCTRPFIIMYIKTIITKIVRGQKERSIGRTAKQSIARNALCTPYGILIRTRDHFMSKG